MAPPESAPAELLIQARRWLDDSRIRATPREEKVAFLRSKGLSDVAIEQLLGQPSSTTASSKGEGSSSRDEKKAPDPPRDIVEAQSSSSPEHATPSVSAPASSPSPPGSVTAQPESETPPPIITYPEWAVRPTRPPPLVTLSRLITGLYALVGASTVAYGAARLVVAPMAESLDDSRADLSEHVSAGLDDLLARLEAAVSTIPPRHSHAPAAAAAPRAPAADDAASSIADDPAEVYHRDTGTQTADWESDGPDPANGSAAAAAAAGSAGTKPISPCDVQSAHVSRLAALARDVCDGIASQTDDLAASAANMGVFGHDLERLEREYSMMPSATAAGGSGAFGRSYIGDGMWPGVGQAQQDELTKVRGEIRRIKGLLLGAKSFPSVVG